MTIKGKAILVKVEIGEKGGSGSGNWGHRGRAGKLGGSVPGKGGGAGGSTVQEGHFDRNGKWVPKLPKPTVKASSLHVNSWVKYKEDGKTYKGRISRIKGQGNDKWYDVNRNGGIMYSQIPLRDIVAKIKPSKTEQSANPEKL